MLLTIVRDARSDYYTKDEEAAANLILPHMHAALNLHVRQRQRNLGLAEQLFGETDDAIALVGLFRQALFVNSAFQDIARVGTNLTIRNDRISFQRLLKDADDACELLLSTSSDAAPRYFRIRPASDALEHRFLMIARLPTPIAEMLGLGRPLVVLKLANMPTSRARACQLAGIAFGLSRAETRVLSDLVAGRSIEEIAVRCDTAPSTVRVQLKAIYAKSGIHRQAELVSHVLTVFDPALRIGL